MKANQLQKFENVLEKDIQRDLVYAEDNKNPLLSFRKPFQSGEGTCYPIYYKNYYDTQYTPMFGGKKGKKGKKTPRGKKQKGGESCPAPLSYSDGVDLKAPTGLDLKANFGPFVNPPTGDAKTGPQYAKQPLVPTAPSTVADYPGGYVEGEAVQALVGSGVEQPKYPLDKQFLENNLSICYATQAGGSKRRGRSKTPAKKTRSKTPAKKSRSKTPPKKGRKHKGGESQYDGRLASGYSPQNDVTTLNCSLSGGKRKNKKGGDEDVNNSQRQAQLNNSFDSFSNGLSRANQATAGGSMMYKDSCGKNQPTNMDKGDICHPEWIIEEKTGGAAKPKSRGRSKTPAKKSRSKTPPKKGRSKTPAKKGRSKTPTKRSKSTGRKHKGGVSDFATTLQSRGPVNYPDGPTADRFRFFNKTGTFIPNSQLKFAAAPILTGVVPDPNPYPVAFNEYCGGKKQGKKAAKKPAKKTEKKPAKKPAKKDKKSKK